MAIPESERVFDPDSIRPGVPTAGQPPAPSGVLPSEAYEVEILRNEVDGTQVQAGSNRLNRYPEELRSASFPASGPPVLTLAPREAAMLGVYRMIEKLRWYAIDLEALAKGGAATTRVSVHTLDAVFLDWPDDRKEIMPAQRALITGPERASFEAPSGFSARILDGGGDDTRDRFGENTVLRYLGKQDVPLMLIFWCAHKDQRRGLEARVAQLFAAERHNDSMGRRIILPEYFSRTIRYTLLDTERPDGADAARANEWILSFSLLAEVPHVELVWSPGTVERTVVGVEAEPA